jgi:hypothetical protein
VPTPQTASGAASASSHLTAAAAPVTTTAADIRATSRAEAGTGATSQHAKIRIATGTNAASTSTSGATAITGAATVSWPGSAEINCETVVITPRLIVISKDIRIAPSATATPGRCGRQVDTARAIGSG